MISVSDAHISPPKEESEVYSPNTLLWFVHFKNIKERNLKWLTHPKPADGFLSLFLSLSFFHVAVGGKWLVRPVVLVLHGLNPGPGSDRRLNVAVKTYHFHKRLMVMTWSEVMLKFVTRSGFVDAFLTVASGCNRGNREGFHRNFRKDVGGQSESFQSSLCIVS